MLISNFKLVGVIGNSPLSFKFRATVDVYTGVLFWKKKETKDIFKTYTSLWYYTDTGECVGVSAENLCRAFEARHGEDLQNIQVFRQ